MNDMINEVRPVMQYYTVTTVETRTRLERRSVRAIVQVWYII
jgi:hypothetical protein